MLSPYPSEEDGVGCINAIMNSVKYTSIILTAYTPYTWPTFPSMSVILDLSGTWCYAAHVVALNNYSEVLFWVNNLSHTAYNLQKKMMTLYNLFHLKEIFLFLNIWYFVQNKYLHLPVTDASEYEIYGVHRGLWWEQIQTTKCKVYTCMLLCIYPIVHHLESIKQNRINMNVNFNGKTFSSGHCYLMLNNSKFVTWR